MPCALSPEPKIVQNLLGPGDTQLPFRTKAAVTFKLHEDIFCGLPAWPPSPGRTGPEYRTSLYFYEYNDPEVLSMDIESQSLTTCEVAPDGNTVVLGFTDSSGAPARIRLPLNQIGALAMTLPDLITKALQSRHGDHTLRYAYPLASWTVERSSEPGTGMMTLSTTDGFSV